MTNQVKVLLTLRVRVPSSQVALPARKAVKKGALITLLEAPYKQGHTFLYWDESRYQPGDTYKVESDHTFTAVYAPDNAGYAPNPEKPVHANNVLPTTGDAFDATIVALVALISGTLSCVCRWMRLVSKEKQVRATVRGGRVPSVSGWNCSHAFPNLCRTRTPHPLARVPEPVSHQRPAPPYSRKHAPARSRSPKPPSEGANPASIA